jgi:uncharacterized protein YlxW (UPF0749 family)
MGPNKHNVWKKDKIMTARSKEMALLQASKSFEVPEYTLKNKVNSKEHNIDKLVNIQKCASFSLPYDNPPNPFFA